MSEWESPYDRPTALLRQHRAPRRGVRRDVSAAARAAPTHRRARRQIKPSADPARPAGAGRFICELSVSFHFPA